jgi:predicted nucleic acid-binding protein
VVDADCLVAGVLTTRGATSRLLDKWLAGDFELVLCPRLIYEVQNALLSPPIADRYEISVADAKAFSRKLEEEGMLVDIPVDPPRAVPDDPNDDYLVALALTTDPGILVTRDRHFEKVDEERIRIVNPGEALSLLA